MTASVFGREPADIERAIESTRHELERTLDALQAKLSPRQRLEDAAETALDAIDTVRGTGRQLVGDAQEMFRRNPVPFLVVGGTLLAAIVAGALIRNRSH
jgi:hypothetical protein